MLTSLAALLAFTGLGTAIPSFGHDGGSQRHQQRQAGMPVLRTPYQQFQASSYSQSDDIYTFKNIRFGAPPTGDMRFAAPAAPANNATLSDGSYGPACIQTPANQTVIGASPQGNANETAPNTSGAEDCLFLDVYVPGGAARNPGSNQLPIVIWLFGGGYAFGSKDLYTGNGLMTKGGNKFIFVAPNYRLGAFGFLAGSSMEANGFPNAGLADQMAAISWVQDYAHLFGGNKSDISLWGESAGAGSIEHLLIWQGGKADLGINKAVLQSPAFQPLFDRQGGLEQSFQEFATNAGCQGRGLPCLRQASIDNLTTANSISISKAPAGTFGFGPSTDGRNIRQLPQLEFATGNYYKGMDSLILSHVQNEAQIFTPTNVQTDDDFNNLLQSLFPGYAQAAGVNQQIEQFYTSPNTPGSPYTQQFDRVRDFFRDASFASNTRVLTGAYPGKTYNMQYSIPPGLHGTDVPPTFFNPNLAEDAAESNPLSAAGLVYPGLPMSQNYQSYLVSHAITGDPNMLSTKPCPTCPIQWPTPANTNGSSGPNGNMLGNVLNVFPLGFQLVDDDQNQLNVSNQWAQFYSAATQLGGLSPPGAVLSQGVINVQGDPSRNFNPPPGSSLPNGPLGPKKGAAPQSMVGREQFVMIIIAAVVSAVAVL